MSEPEEKIVRSSSVLISSGKKVRLYRSIEEVPSRLRKRLIESTNGINAGTILIANRAGRERILEVYQAAIQVGYRFYSFGDAMLIL